MLNPKTSGNLAVFVGTLLLAIFPMKVYAGDLVSARYITSEGQKIVMELEIQSPAPNTVIVIQHLPKGTDIKQSHPPFDKYNPKHGEAKWLLKKVKPGTLRISMEIAGSVRSGEVKGEIRYKNPSTGTMSRIYVSP
ncbi:MAG: hypothetical protein LWX01_08620 [Deltaproteobacteria bacterium]|nr:hypothetical protein [Deltaproteobacteria bacterium]MDL1961741.1 hypothetical protein [Deltaproteobacteria bacterium]